MAWVVLVVSGMPEAVWATALGRSEGFSRPLPTGVFAAGPVLGMPGPAFAPRTVPVGTGYAVRAGVGAVLTAAYAMAFDGGPAGPLKWRCRPGSSAAWRC